MFNLDFQKDLRILLSPRHQHLKDQIHHLLEKENLEDHFVILSSGTTSDAVKGYALSRRALMKNAQAVNDFYEITSRDKWALSLPPYHVGGLSVLVRAQMSGSEVVSFPAWQAAEWTKKIEEEKVTISTIVPTQLYDLVHLNLTPPPRLRALVVGGDFLSDTLEELALRKGWPVFRTFGMTEVCSQLASSKSRGSKNLEVLPIHAVKSDQERLLLKSESLFTLQFVLKANPQVQLAAEFCDENGYFKTQDRVLIDDNTLLPTGRLDDQIKISGRLFSLLALRNTLEQKLIELGLFQKAEIQIQKDDRKGQRLVLFVHKDLHQLEEILSALPLKPDEVIEVDSFQRTDLGKLKKKF